MAYIRFDVPRALRAARALSANPDDLPQVFTIIESLSGNTLQRIGNRMQRDPVGRRLIEGRGDIVDLLADRAALARLPEGSLGRAYLAFVEREGISAEGIRAAAAQGMTGETPLPPPLDWVHARMRDTHDLWHAAVGYSGDVLGETALLAFIFAQSQNPAIALILAIGMSKTLGFPGGGAQARRTIADGFRRGLKARWLPAQDWESMLAMPVEEVRRRLGLGAPPVYRQIRSSELESVRDARETRPGRGRGRGRAKHAEIGRQDQSSTA
jgi:ubiquinone biosynthesis protein COQ4